MGFTKPKGQHKTIDQFNFADLSKSQLWVLADFMGVRNKIWETSEHARSNVLAAHCKGDPIRAQVGLDVIYYHKAAPVGSDDAKTAQKLVDVLNGYSKSLEDLSTVRLDATLAKAKKAFSEQIIEELKELEKKAPRRIEIVQPGKPPKKIKDTLPPEFERMLQLASQRIPIMLVGPAGCGKTWLAAKLAEALELEYSDQSCSEGMSESIFNGWLLPIGKGGEFQHVPSPFLERYETGGVMLLDEIDAGDANLFTYINKAIANHSYTVAQRYKKPVVTKSDDFVLIAAANTFGHGADAMYCGRNQLDAATLDRFKVGLVCLDYSEKVERSLAHNELCEWAWKIRAKIREHKLRRVMSTRTIEQLAKMSEAYHWAKTEWSEAYFAGWPESERRLVA